MIGILIYTKIITTQISSPQIERLLLNDKNELTKPTNIGNQMRRDMAKFDLFIPLYVVSFSFFCFFFCSNDYRLLNRCHEYSDSLFFSLCIMFLPNDSISFPPTLQNSALIRNHRTNK